MACINSNFTVIHYITKPSFKTLLIYFFIQHRNEWKPWMSGMVKYITFPNSQQYCLQNDYLWCKIDVICSKKAKSFKITGMSCIIWIVWLKINGFHINYPYGLWVGNKKIFCPLCQNTVTFTGMGQKYEREERLGSRMVTAHTAGPQLSLALLRFIPLFLPRFLSVSSLSNKGQKT